MWVTAAMTTPRTGRAGLLLGVLVALQSSGVRAEEPATPPAVDAAPAVKVAAAAPPVHGPRRPARRGDRGRLHLRDGSVVEGRLVTASDEGDAVDLADGKRRVFPGHSVLEVEPIVEPEPWATLEEGEVLVVLHDGGSVTGRLLGHEDGTIQVQESSGALRSIRSDEVKLFYGPSGPLPPLRSGTSPARARALWAQTALVLDPGEVTLTSSQLLTAQAAAGLFRWTMLSAGTTVPVWYATDAGGNATLRLTVGAEVLPRLHLAGGLEAWLSGQGSVVSIFAAATFVGEGWWGSLYLGPPPTSAERLGSFGDQLLALSAGWRFTPHLSALVEAWKGRGSGGQDLLVSAAARIRLWKLDVDAGLLTAPDARLVPVLSISGTLVTP
jgi:hypothetical protein